MDKLDYVQMVDEIADETFRDCNAQEQYDITISMMLVTSAIPQGLSIKEKARLFQIMSEYYQRLEGLEK